MKRSDIGKPIKGKLVGPPVKDESDHFYVCQICGQSVDARDLRQVFWHEEPEHEPLELDG